MAALKCPRRITAARSLSDALLAIVFFLSTAGAARPGDITSCEFSWDVDPREGAVRTATPEDLVRHVCSGEPPGPRDHSACEFTLDIPLTDANGKPLTSGDHTLWLRSCDAEGCAPWVRRRHCIPRPDDWHIVGGEWFLDDARVPDQAPEEPLDGSGNSLDLDELMRCDNAAGDPLAWIELVPPDGDLSPGSHAIGFRLQDSEGVWGPTRWETVVIPPSSPISGVFLTGSGPLDGSCTPRFLRPDPAFPDIELEPDPEQPGWYSAEVDLSSFGAADVSELPLFVRAESSTGATLVQLPGSSSLPAVTFLRGDCDGQESIELTDAVFLFNWLFLGGPRAPCLVACNTNDDAALDITDGVFLLNFLFLGGSPPPAPHPDCGRLDEADRAIGCEEPPPDCSAFCSGPSV